MTYELITPSDAITFKAESDKVAFFCALILGNGKAGISRQDSKGVEQSPMLLFHPDPLSVINGYLGCEIQEFGDQNAAAVSDCFLSFAYGNFSDREAFDNEVESFKTDDAREEYLKNHEDKNRSSMSKWVKGAWGYGESFKKKADEAKETPLP